MGNSESLQNSVHDLNVTPTFAFSFSNRNEHIRNTKHLIPFDLNVSMYWDLIELDDCWLLFSNTWCWPSSHHMSFLMYNVFLISLVFSKVIFEIWFLKGHPKFWGLCIVLGVIFWSEPRHHTSQTSCEQINVQDSKIVSPCLDIKKCNLDYAFRNNMIKTEGTMLANQREGKNLRFLKV